MHAWRPEVQPGLAAIAVLIDTDDNNEKYFLNNTKECAVDLNTFILQISTDGLYRLITYNGKILEVTDLLEITLKCSSPENPGTFKSQIFLAFLRPGKNILCV